MRTSQRPDIPQINGSEPFDELVRKFSVYFIQHIDTAHSFEELRRTIYAGQLKPLVTYLVDESHHPALLNALLALKWHFAAVEASDDRGISQTRGLACELVAWRFITHVTQWEAIDFLCYQLPPVGKRNDIQIDNVDGNEESAAETSPLLENEPFNPDTSYAEDDPEAEHSGSSTSFASTFAGLNALEIAAVADAKKFLSQNSIQRIIDGIWNGDIVFWETLGQHSVKQAKIYNEKRSDPFCRLRVPVYAKAFEVLFFAGFIAFYYTVLVQKSTHAVTGSEVMLYIWLAAFAYNEMVEFLDAGSALYAVDFWSLWDIGIIVTGTIFLVVRSIGLVQDDHKLIDTAFDILSVEALFLVPRICSLLSLTPYFGTLLPCLKEMTKDFVKFLGLVAILYIGFNTTFAFLARGVYSVRHMNWILIKVFFGSSYLGFDVAEEISPILGPPLMFIFVCLTNILLITSLISLLSNSLTKVIEHAREEYLSVYAVYVLEASTSNRLTYFIPPLNLIPLLLRPLRICVSADRLRAARIVMLKATHWPFVALILAWERGRQYWRQNHATTPSVGHNRQGLNAAMRRRPLSGRSYKHPLLVADRAQAPLGIQARTDRLAEAAGQQAMPNVIELRKAVHDLKVQADRMEALLAQRMSGNDIQVVG